TPARQFEPNDLIGEAVGGYLIESFLGPTETGPVYQGRRPGADGPRAVKVIIPALTQDSAFRRRFHERKQAMQALVHPHIVSIEAIGEDNGLCYVAVEWLPDGTLRNLMQRRGSAAWSLPMGLDLVRQAADALSFAHKQGFVHGSIKPNNLVVVRRTDGQSGYTLKVTDFGLAALLMEQEGALEDIWGDSLIYALSPERCRGQEIDGRSDQYALGVIIYELATGSVPFEAKTLDSAVFRHVYTAPVPPRDIIPELPATLEAITLRCLAKLPDERFRDASDLATALQDLLRSPAMAPKLSFTPQPTRNGAVGERPSGPVIPRVQALDQYGRALATHDLTGDGLTVGRDPRNMIVLDGETIEPSHLEMDWDGSAILVTSLAATATVVIGDAPLRPRETRVWHWDEPMRLGPFWLRVEPVPLSSASAAAGATPSSAFGPSTADLAPGGPAPVVIALPSPGGPAPSGRSVTIPPEPSLAPAAPESAAPVELLTERIGIILDQEALTLTPGRPATFRMTLLNLGSIVDHFKVVAEGVPESWIVGQAPQVQLNPGAKDLVILNILVPQVPESLAQEYPVTIRVRSRENPRESNTADALWTVLPFAISSFDLRPKKRRRLLKGLYRVQVNNQGNAPVTYNLSANDEEEALGFIFGNDQMNLAPGGVGRTDLQVRPNQMRWFGQPVQHRFAVLAKPASQGETHNSSAQLVQRVFFSRWLLALLFVGLLLGLALAWFLYLPKIVTLTTVPAPEKLVAGNPFAVRWSVTNGPIVELRVNQTPMPVAPGSSSRFLPGYQSPPVIELLARNQLLGRDSSSLNVSLIAPSPTFTNTPTPVPTRTPEPPTPIPPPTLAPTEPPTPTVPSPTPTITPTPTSQALCQVNGTLTLTGTGPPKTAVVVYFDGRPVGGGLTDSVGRFVIVLGRFREVPGRHPLTVEVRDTHQVLLFITCIVPTPVPLETNTPTATSATPSPQR
ncbi:protein kinase, partial [Chloroflexales bacterium ZM16-3]|nr:protein kinase [Chloroflexales bacterium ZM16-3]